MAPVAIPQNADHSFPEAPRGPKRPGGITLLAIFDLIAGIILVAIGLLAVTLLQSLLVFGGIVTIVGSLSLVVSYGCLRAEPWTRTAGIATGASFMVLGIFLAALYAIGIPLFFLGGWTIYLMTRQGTKVYLRGVTRPEN